MTNTPEPRDVQATAVVAHDPIDDENPYSFHDRATACSIAPPKELRETQ
ncbi:hypothetical protein [uncultured Sulfitobacter sp.]|nr:hypothetical protein [uncultured Sulfitobacter sp.]